jgi:hypothetical protein
MLNQSYVIATRTGRSLLPSFAVMEKAHWYRYRKKRAYSLLTTDKWKSLPIHF